MYKKLSVSMLSGAILLSGAASAMEFDPKFAVGAEGTYSLYKVKGDQQYVVDGKNLYKKKGLGANAFVNVRLTENVALEAGYGFHKKHSPSTTTGKLSSRHRNIYADILAIMPVDSCMDIIAGVGIGRLQTKGSETTSVVKNAWEAETSKKASYRVRLGAQYKFDEHVAARFMLTHQKGNKLIKHMQSASLGLVYSF